MEELKARNARRVFERAWKKFGREVTVQSDSQTFQLKVILTKRQRSTHCDALYDANVKSGDIIIDDNWKFKVTDISEQLVGKTIIYKRVFLEKVETAQS